MTPWTSVAVRERITARPHGSVACFNGDASHSLWIDVTLCPNCIVGPSRRFASVARFESWEKFNFSSVDWSASQSDHMPEQALANQTACLCVRGGRLMWLVVGRTPDTPTGKLQRTLPCGRTVRATWEIWERVRIMRKVNICEKSLNFYIKMTEFWKKYKFEK